MPDDYKGIFSQEYFETPKSKKTYTVKLTHRVTKEVAWSGTVEAYSSKNAQSQWRKEYSHIRSEYDHSYCLLISLQKY
tara:strand:+ start:7950 stop:8183 length:234 start_codon:yes stop_codon:yes gene_type:complete